MRQSQLFVKTMKDDTKGKLSVNAKFLTRGGFVDKLIAEAHSYLPLGFRAFGNIEKIIREEINSIGGVELLMPTLYPLLKFLNS